MSFGARLDLALDARGSLCVGIDPHVGLLRDWGLSEDVAGLDTFAGLCVEAFGEVAAVIKPQSAFFERFGSAGVAVLERTIAAARAAGALVVLDVKRGDIGSTMASYAGAYLDASAPMASDAITVSPYLGVGSLKPAFDVAAANDAGVFVLALTSNKEGPQFQHAMTKAGISVAQTVINELLVRNGTDGPMGSLGVVIGATIGESVADLRGLNGPYLVPGIGAQGGTAADVRRIFGVGLRNVLPSVSREVLRLGPDLAGMREAVHRFVGEYEFLRSDNTAE
jgi:orotidine-5'-phosphate decarboxylase